MNNEKKFFEQQPGLPETKIEIFTNRHGKKTNIEGLPNEMQDLTEGAIAEIITKANSQKEKDNSEKLQVFAGSERFRAIKTKILLEMPELVEELKPAKSIDEIREVIKKQVNFGTKFYTTDKLDFNDQGPMGEESNAAYKAGEYLQYLINKSDQRAIDLKDNISSSYTTHAGNIAELVDKYVKVGNNFNRIVAGKNENEKEEYKKYGNKLGRHFGTHQGPVECFLAKVLEKELGEEAKEEFINSYAGSGGFKELEGTKIDILNKGAEQKILIHYRIKEEDRTVEIEPELLQEIIKEKKLFIEKINKLKLIDKKDKI
jgi:hypothetical protein